MGRDIDHIIERVRQRFPSLRVWQLEVAHPGADDDGLWVFTLPGAEEIGGRPKVVQLESSSGVCPFIVEHDHMSSSSEAERAGSVDEAVTKVCAYLRTLV